MRIVCTHGFFQFFESRAGELSDFIERYDVGLVSKGDYFTFEKLADAPVFSLPGIPYLDATATEIFEGTPGEVMRKNGLVYNFDSDLVMPIELITDVVSIETAGNFFFSDGLILPGALTVEGLRVTDYSAWFSRDSTRFKYSEVIYV